MIHLATALRKIDLENHFASSLVLGDVEWVRSADWGAVSGRGAEWGGGWARTRLRGKVSPQILVFGVRQMGGLRAKTAAV